MKITASFISMIALLLLINTAISCKKADTKEETTSQPETVVENAPNTLEPDQFGDGMKSNGAVIIDLRFPVDYEQGHIDGAININFLDEHFKDNILTLDKTKKYYIYGKGDAQTKRTGIYMRQNGFTDVNVMKGGWEAWKESQKK